MFGSLVFASMLYYIIHSPHLPTILPILQSCYCQEQLIRDHNNRFNPRGVKRGEPSNAENEAREEPERKRLCIEKTMNLSDESLLEDKLPSTT